MKTATWKVNLAVFVAIFGFCALAYALGQAVTPFILAAIFSYILDPAVDAMHRRGFPRGLLAALFVVVFLVVAVGSIGGVVYVLKLEIPELIKNLPAYISTFETDYLPGIRRTFHLSEEVDVKFLAGQFMDKLLNLPPESITSAAGYAASVVGGTLNVFLTVLNLLLVPIIMVYLLVDFDRFRNAFLDSLPPGHKEAVLEKLSELEGVLRDFVKGQLIVALIMGVMYCIGLWIVGVDLPILVGMSAGILNLVPYLGTTLGFLVSVTLVLLKYHDTLHPLLVFGVFAAVQAVEGYIVTPKVVGDRLGLHPVIIILSLVVFGHLMGFVGILLAVPIAAVLKVFIYGFLKDYKHSRLFAGGE